MAEAPFAVMPPEKSAVMEDASKPLETREKQGQACPQGLQREHGPPDMWSSDPQLPEPESNGLLSSAATQP